MFSRNKKHSHSPNSPSVDGRSQARDQLQVPTKSQSQSHTPQTQEPQTLYPWSAHTAPSGKWPSPFPRRLHSLSTDATAAGELFLFGGVAMDSKQNDLYVISTRDFSTTLLKTSGDVPKPRYGHRVVLTSTTLLVWGGRSDSSEQNAQNESDDDSFYLLSLVSREWTRIVVNGPGPGSRYYHTMTLVGSKLFVFGGWICSTQIPLNDIWVLDLNLNSDPFWESYEPAPGDERPLPRVGHVSVTTGDRIIIFGGYDHSLGFNDTWSFNISARKWTKLECTGSIPTSRAYHAAVLIDDVMFVYGGVTDDEGRLGDLTALDLSTQRWVAFQDIGPSPCGRSGHAMAHDGTRVFMLGGLLSTDARENEEEAKPIHVLDTKLLVYPKSDSNTVKHSEKTTQFAEKLSAGHLTQDQPQYRIFSSSDVGAALGAFPFQMAASEKMGHPSSPPVTCERNHSFNDLPSRHAGANGGPRGVLEEDDDSEGSTSHAKLVAPDAPSRKEITRLEDGRLTELERQLSETLAAKTECDQRIGQLTEELALKSEQAEANVAEEKRRAGLELHKLLISIDHVLEQAKANAAEEMKRAGLERRKLQVRLDELSLSRDHALEQAQSALLKASCAAEANEQSNRELTKMRAELEASKSESAALRMRLAEVGTYPTTATEPEPRVRSRSEPGSKRSRTVPRTD